MQDPSPGCYQRFNLTPRLRAWHVPYMTPAVCLVYLQKQGKIDLQGALEKLELLGPFISDDEYNTVKWALESWRAA